MGVNTAKQHEEHICSASTVQSLTQHTNPEKWLADTQLHTHAEHSAPCTPLKVCRWLMAAGKRPVPFRTRKLSPPAPMVLPPGGSGRVGYRRPNNFTHRHPPHNCLCGGCLLLVLHVCGCPHCGQPHPHQQLVCTHGLYESTQHPHRRKTDLGKRNIAVDSCTTGAPHGLLVAL